MGNLSIRWSTGKTPGTALVPAPSGSSASMSFRLAIPWRDALQQGPPPLHQPGTACSKPVLPVEHFSSNGKLSLNCLSHPRGQAHPTPLMTEQSCLQDRRQSEEERAHPQAVLPPVPELLRSLRHHEFFPHESCPEETSGHRLPPFASTLRRRSSGS